MSSGNDQPRPCNVLRLRTQSRYGQQIAKVERYWNSVRNGRLVPSRCEIDPRGLDGVLDSAFILERIAGGLARFRIAGSSLNQFTGLELRHMPISSLFLPDSRAVLSEALNATFDEPAIVRMSLVAPTGFGRDHLEGEMILLPLRSDLGDIDRVLGAMTLGGRIGRTPRRVEIVSQERQSLVGYAGPNPVLTQPPRPNGAQHEIHTIGAKTPVGEKMVVRPRHLRLVVSNER